MKLNKIDEVWNSANSIFKLLFWFVVVQKFCYHGNVTQRLLLSLKEPTEFPKQSHSAIRHRPSLGENWSSSGQFCFKMEWTRHSKFAICSDPSFTLRARPFVFQLIKEMRMHPKNIERFHMTSRRPYWCFRTIKRRLCWCSKPILWELNAFFCSNNSA